MQSAAKKQAMEFAVDRLEDLEADDSYPTPVGQEFFYAANKSP